MGTDKILDRAILMANKDGHKWANLNDIYKNAYRHNTETAIETESRSIPVPVKPGEAPAKEPEKCYYCKGAEWLDTPDGMKPCPECNPVGLNRPESIKEEEPEIIQHPAERVLKANQYFCSKCGIVHSTDKKVGKRHLKYRVKMQ